MNGNPHYDYWYAQAAAAAGQQRETAEYKRLLFILAMSVIAVTVVVQVAALLVFTTLPVFPTHPDWAMFVAGLEVGGSSVNAQDVAYFSMWLANDIIVYVPPLLAFGFIFRNRLDYQKPGSPYVFKNIWVLPFFLAGVAIATGSSILTNVISELLSGVFGGDSILPEVFGDVMPQTNMQMLMMLFTVGIVAPICEEIIYRHLLLRPLRRYGDLQAIIITSILFGFFHGNLTQFLYSAMVGLILGIAAVKANSVIPAIIIHMMNNIYVVLSAHFLELSERGEIPLNSVLLSAFSIFILVIGVVALAIMVVKNILTVENYNPYIFPRERIRLLWQRPSIIIMAVLLVLITIF